MTNRLRLIVMSVIAILVISTAAFDLKHAYATETYQLITTWGSFGLGNGQFNNPNGVAVDSSGNVYVADTDNDRIQKFDSSGNFITSWGSAGIGDSQFAGPYGIAIDSSGNVYVADEYNNRIQKFDSSGNFITSWGSDSASELAVDSSGNVYVINTGNYFIQKFDSNGTLLTTWGSFGSGNGQFYYVSGIATDSSGNVYVSDGESLFHRSDRIQKFDSSGNFITSWGTTGSGNGQFRYPVGIAVDSSGNVYVVDTGNSRIQKFDSSGNFITKWYASGIHLAVDSSGNVYVPVREQDNIEKFAQAQLYCGKTINQFDNIINGTASSEILVGTSGNDLILGNGGDDRIFGKDGNDCIIAHDGNGYLSGGLGNDTIEVSGTGNNKIWGGPDNDTIDATGSSGDNKIFGGPGTDILQGGRGNDTIWGQADNDILDGGGGSNVCIDFFANPTFYSCDRIYQQSIVDVTISPGDAHSNACSLTQTCYAPSMADINLHDTVRWTNRDGNFHTVTSGHLGDINSGSLFDSSNINPNGGTFLHKFDTAGTFDYHCNIHPWMAGQVVVH